MKHEVSTHSIGNTKVCKAIIMLLLVLFTSICSFAQNIDWINAPLNPVPQGMDLKYQHLKGDVMQESILDYFTRDGKWFSYRGNEMLKKDAQGRIIEYRDEKGNAYPYQYDSKGNLISSSGSTYEYDNKNRLIKANHKYETSQYSYKNQGDLLIITEKSTFDGKTNESEHHYKNGLRILQKSSGGGLKYEYTFDDKGNWISKETIDAATNKALFNQYTGKPLKPTIRNIIYYSDYDKGLSAITVQLKDLTEGRVANAPLIPHPFFNGKELEKQMIARLIDDYVFYEPLAKTYYIARNAFLKTNKVGQKIPVEILISGEENILLYNGKYIGVVEKGSKGEDENDWKTINYTETLSSFVSVHQKTGSAYAFENIPKISNGKTVAIVGKSIPDFWYATINNKNGIYVFKNGLALNLKSVSGYLANSKTQDLIVAVEGGTEYILPDYENSVDKKFYKARLFNPATDKIQTQKSSSSNTSQTTTTTASSNTLEQTTETRYYNGKYTKETALQKANDFFNRTNGEKITFTKMEKKSGYQFVGNWIIKGADESLQSKIEYSFEDDGLKIKINEIVLNDKYGTLKMDKNHKDEAVRKTAENLYTSINDLYVKAVFVHLDINNNKTSKQTTTTTSSNTNTADLYSGLSAEAGAYMALYKMNPKGLKNYIGNMHKSWEQKSYSEEKISQTYADMFQEIYAKDKYPAFLMIIHLPDSWLSKERLGGIFSKLTKEQQLYIQETANNYKPN